jgi:hypothetical protein
LKNNPLRTALVGPVLVTRIVTDPVICHVR